MLLWFSCLKQSTHITHSSQFTFLFTGVDVTKLTLSSEMSLSSILLLVASSMGYITIFPLNTSSECLNVHNLCSHDWTFLYIFELMCKNLHPSSLNGHISPLLK